MSTCGPLDAVPKTDNLSDMKPTDNHDNQALSIYEQGFMDSLKKMADVMQNQSAKSLIDACRLDFSGDSKDGTGTTGSSINTPRETALRAPESRKDTDEKPSRRSEKSEEEDKQRRDAERAAERLKAEDVPPINIFKKLAAPEDRNPAEVFKPDEKRGPMDPLPHPLPKDQARIDQRANDIISRIKDDGFGSDPARTEILRMMQQAARGDYLPELIESINKKLKEKGSDTELQLDTQVRFDENVWKECNPTYRHETHTVKLNKAGQQTSDEIEFRNSVRIGRSPCDSFRYGTPSGKWISSPLQLFTIPGGR